MVAHHIHHALAQVKELQQKILDKQRFKGYSGRARAIAGTLALISAIVMSQPFYPSNITAQFLGWAVLFVVAITLNYGAIVYWFLFDPSVNRDARKLKPLIDILPPIIVGGLFTLIFMLHNHHQYLFGTWMMLFGLANFATRHVVPREITLVGLFYVIFGFVTLYFWSEDQSFLNPWPMGIIFFVGEWFGGVILHFDGLDKLFAKFNKTEDS
jgi:hypothetical protein